MNISRLHMENLMMIEESVGNDEFFEAMLNFDNILFEDGFYKVGPTVVEMDPAKFEEPEQVFQFYVPVNGVVETETSQWVDELDYPIVLRDRAPFNEDIGDVLSEMVDYLNEKEITYGPHLLLVLSRIYDEYWADILIPLETGDIND